MASKKAIIVPGTEEGHKKWGFSAAVKSGNVLYISGQTGHSAGEVPPDAADQARLAFLNMKRVVEQAGGTLEDVVDLLTFHTNMADLPKFIEVKAEFFSTDFPAWTAIGTTALASPNFKLEIKAIAIIKE